MKNVVKLEIIIIIINLLTAYFINSKDIPYSDLQSAIVASYLDNINKYLQLIDTTEEKAKNLYKNKNRMSFIFNYEI